VARRALSRPEGPVARHTPPPHDAWRRDLWTGELRLRLETRPGQYVSPGSGRLGLVRVGSEDVVVQRAATFAGAPVIPGSGIKGAVRTLYELLSFSCNPLAGSACRPQDCCDACAVFGVLGYAGRLGFTDARPQPPNAARVEVQKVPIPWTPDASKTAGDFRLYDLEEATTFEKGRRTPQPAPKKLSREVFVGAFETRMTFWNLESQELGRLLLAMGVGADEATRFPLRLGGVKYDGKGTVSVSPHRLRLARPEARDHEGEAYGAEQARWIEAARSSPWAGPFWPKLLELAAILRPQR
jgi:RAMP superfamily